MRKKLVCVLLAAVFFVLSVPASADMLWEPFDNQYYLSNSHEYFQYMDRTYVVPEGMTANLYKSPKTGGLIETLEAGTRIYIGPYFTVGDEVWGAGYPRSNFGQEGWVRVNRLQEEYGTEAFAQDYGSQFVTTDDVLTREDIDGDIYSWTYPGSGIQDRTVPADALGGGYNDGVMNFIHVYTDPNGGRWGYVGYYMGSCGWVWLDDPTNPEPPYLSYPGLSSTVTDTSPETDPGSGSILWITVAVIALAAVTAAAIVLLKKKAKKA